MCSSPADPSELFRRRIELRRGIRLALGFDRLLSFTCVNVRWKVDAEAVVDAFARFSISLLWDFAEPNPIGDAAGSWLLCYERIATALDTFTKFSPETEAPTVLNGSAVELPSYKPFDVIKIGRAHV